MSMKIVGDVLYWLYRAGVPAMLEGVHGIGKTSLLYQLHAKIAKLKGQNHEHLLQSTVNARDLVKLSRVGANEFGLWASSAANLTIEEAIGYPQPKPDDTIHYLRSHSFIPPPDHAGGGILSVDELNLSDQTLERALMSIALEGRFLDYVLPPDIMVVTSQNPAAGEYHARRLNPPTVNRFCWIKVLAVNGEVLQHFTERDFHDAIIACISEHGDSVLNPHQLKIEFNNDQVPTSRSWEYVNRLMQKAEGDEIARLGLIAFAGLLGPSAAGVFQKFALERGERSIPVDEVLTGYGYDPKTYIPYKDQKTGIEGTRVKDIKETPIRKRVRKISQAASVRMDLVSAALTVLAARLSAIGEEVRKQSAGQRGTPWEVMTEEQRAAVINSLIFLCDVPPDLAGTAFMKRLQTNDAFTYTIYAAQKHSIMKDYHDHWAKAEETAFAAGDGKK